MLGLSSAHKIYNVDMLSSEFQIPGGKEIVLLHPINHDNHILILFSS